jgi:hypothetical protein
MEQIKIIRLKDGCDIITSIELVKGEYVIKQPMILDIIQRGKLPELNLTNWLPVQVIENNETIISVDEVVCTMEPNSHLKEYYVNLVDRIQTFATTEKERSESEEYAHQMALATALEELETYKGISIH